MQAAVINGRAIEYRVEGPADGPVLALAGALGTDLRVWEPLMDRLPAGWRVLRHSMAGHGLSDLAEADGHAVAHHAGDLSGLLDHVGAARAVVVGLSVGGMIAQTLAAAAPERVAGLVLCCTAHRIGTPDLWSQRIADVRDKGLAAMADTILERWFSPAFRESRPGELALWRNMLARTTPEGYAAVCAAIREADLSEAARGIAVPTLCVAGTLDGSTPPETVAGLAEIVPGARLETIEGVGHIPCVEAPDRLGALVTGFLEEHRLG
ncbi:MAG: 3-oxoadipate enol-lactonase [Azospirillaceae bacterium]